MECSSASSRRAELPWLVCEHTGRAGIRLRSPHRTRAAYQWSVDISCISMPRRGARHGPRLISCPLQLLVLQGFYQCYAGITLPNPASVGLHEALGFQPVGVYQAVGYKLGVWHDVGWWQRGLQPRPSLPTPPTAFEVLRQTSNAWQAALDAGLQLLRE